MRHVSNTGTRECDRSQCQSEARGRGVATRSLCQENNQLAGLTVMPSSAVGAFTLIFLQLTSTVSSTDSSSLPSLSEMLKWKVSFCFFGSALGWVVRPPILCQSIL